MAKVALLTIHGMGDTETEYSNELKKCLSKEMGLAFEDVDFNEIYYQDILQSSENEVYPSSSVTINMC